MFKTYLREQSEDLCGGCISLSGKLGREISNVIVKHKAFFDGFDKIIVYYDNGQIELVAILNTVFSIHFSLIAFSQGKK